MENNNHTLTIDGKTVVFLEGQTILDAANNAGIYIPTLCYIEGLKPYGGCRLCIVKIENMKGYPPACTTPAQIGMNVITNDLEIQELRREVFKLILSEHPYSCLICDNSKNCEDLRKGLVKAGRVFGCFNCSHKNNCELRRIAKYLEIKDIPYELEYKNYSLKRDDPFFEQDYNLCILCGRCVRICNELRGIGAINFINRGHDTQITTALDALHIDSNCQFCGACVDICPTGALTSKNTKWSEITTNFKKSVCAFCSVGCGFRYYSSKGILTESIPDMEDIVNRGQACIIGRFCTVQFINGKARLKYPYIKKDKDLIPSEWEEVFTFVKEKLSKFKPEQIAVIASPDLTNESAYILNKFSKLILKTSNISTLTNGNSIEVLYHLCDNHLKDTGFRASFNDLENSNLIILANANLQISHPVLLIKLKKAKDCGAKIISFNLAKEKLPIETRKLIDYDFNLGVEDTNRLLMLILEKVISKVKVKENEITNLKVLQNKLREVDFENQIAYPLEIIDILSEILIESKNNKAVAVFGNIVDLPKENEANFLGLLLNLAILSNYKMKFLPLWTRGNLEGVYQNISYNNTCSKEYIFQNIREGKIKALYLTERINDAELLKNLEFLMIQDIYPSDNLQYAHIILPSKTFVEDSGTLLNSALRLQKLQNSAFITNDLKSDWEILCDLAMKMNSTLQYEFTFQNSDEILKEMIKFNPYFAIHSNQNKPANSIEKVLIIPEQDLHFTSIKETGFTLESFKYRGEPIYNQVPDLSLLKSYKILESEELKLLTKEKPLLETEFLAIKNEEIAPNLYILIIRAPLIAEKAKPGNFILLMQYEDSERIPLTLTDWDAKNETITLFYQEVGYSTKELTNLKAGEYLYSVVGPLGKEIEINYFGTVLLGGGCYGNGAIYPIAKAMKEAGNKVMIILESKNKDLFYWEEELNKVSDLLIYCTSDGSKGLKGKIKTGIEYLLEQNFKFDRCYFIGCVYMMMEASDTTKIHGQLPTFVSLNTIMIDGTGMCGCCRLTLHQDGKDITKFACVDGPTFNGHEVNWDELIKRRTALFENEIRIYQKDTCKALEKK